MELARRCVRLEQSNPTVDHKEVQVPDVEGEIADSLRDGPDHRRQSLIFG